MIFYIIKKKKKKKKEQTTEWKLYISNFTNLHTSYNTDS